jgi:succinyl-diaminopimelate desuccinylase
MLEPSVSDVFLTEPGELTELVSAAVREVTGRTPELSTSGGTSDARFIKDHCPVVEFGLVGRTIHQIDEHVPVEDLEALTRIYRRLLDSYFERFGS